jgi:protein-disulfide isomerase
MRAIAAAILTAGLIAAAPAVQAQDGTVAMSELMVEGPLGDVWLGDENAPIVVVEYASMTCPHCRTFHETVYDEFIAKYVDTGLVRFTVREFPLDFLAAGAFMLARCSQDMVGATGYFSMISLLFETQPMWAVAEPLPPLQQLAFQSGFTQEGFDACLTNQEILDAIFAVYDRGLELGVAATPTFFVNGDRYSGALTLEQFDQIIEPMLPAG